MNGMTERTALLLGEDGVERLKKSHVLLFGLGGIVLDFLRIKCGKVHNRSSCGSQFFRKNDKALQMLLFQSQQRDLLFQRLFPVKGGILQNFPDIP